MRVRITCGNVPGAPPYSWQKLAECELDCSGTIDARFCAWRTPGGVKSVNLCELSVPGTEARCRPSAPRSGSDRCSRAGATSWRLQIVGKSWQFSELPADPGMKSMMALDDENFNARGPQSALNALSGDVSTGVDY